MIDDNLKKWLDTIDEGMIEQFHYRRLITDEELVNIVLDKCQWLAEQSIINFWQAELVAEYIPYCTREDLFDFIEHKNKHGFILECLQS